MDLEKPFGEVLEQKEALFNYKRHGCKKTQNFAFFQ